MKYAIASTIALVLCIAAGIGSVQWISAKRAMKLISKILLSAAVSISLIAVAFLVYLEVYYHADAEAEEFLRSANGVKVSESGDAYCFDGPGDTVYRKIHCTLKCNRCCDTLFTRGILQLNIERGVVYEGSQASFVF